MQHDPSVTPQWARPLVAWLQSNASLVLRVGLGIVFIWFGVLKLMPGLSPAEDLAGCTLEILTFHTIPCSTLVRLLGVLECAIGVCLIGGWMMRTVIVVFFLHMLGTFLPFFFFPEQTMSHMPLVPTLVGQYIIKNLVLMAAGLVVAVKSLPRIAASTTAR